MRYLPITAVAGLAIAWIAGCAGHEDPPMSTQPPPGNLLETYWKLVSIEGTPVEPAAGMREAHLVLYPEGNRLGAVGGVNQIAGTWGLSGMAIKLIPGPMTRMAGPEPLMMQESRFVDLLGRVNRYDITVDRLTLYELTTPLMVFEAALPPQ